jgi:hypothetical protein
LHRENETDKKRKCYKLLSVKDCFSRISKGLTNWKAIAMKKGLESRHLGSVGNGLKLTVPVIFALDERTTVELATLELHAYDVSLRLVQQFHRDTQTLTHFFPPVFF